MRCWLPKGNWFQTRRWQRAVFQFVVVLTTGPCRSCNIYIRIGLENLEDSTSRRYEVLFQVNCQHPPNLGIVGMPHYGEKLGREPSEFESPIVFQAATDRVA